MYGFDLARERVRGLHQSPILSRVQSRLAGTVPGDIRDARDAVCAACGIRDRCESRQRTDRAETQCPAYLWPMHLDSARRDLGNTVRHLSMHLYPKGDAWKRNLEALLPHWGLFNGTKAVAVVTDESTSSVDDVRAAFPADVDRWIIDANEPKLREVQTFAALLRDRPAGRRDVMFYCHGKSMQYNGEGVTMRWAREMYAKCLGDFATVKRHLEAFPVVGPFKRYGPFRLPGNYRWHYSGTFFWFRCQELYAIPEWDRITQRWFGMEAWPANHFTSYESGCLFGDDCGDLYQADTWQALEASLELYDESRRNHSAQD